MQAIDFSTYRQSGKYYGGSEKKLGIVIDGEDYMLKFQKRTPFGKRNNHISEFLGSHIFDICGFSTHKTYLGFRGEEQVVACVGRSAVLRECAGILTYPADSLFPLMTWERVRWIRIKRLINMIIRTLCGC